MWPSCKYCFGRTLSGIWINVHVLYNLPYCNHLESSVVLEVIFSYPTKVGTM